MAWIESHQSMSRHRKTNRAVALLKVDRHKFIGHMHELWWWGLDNVAMDGWLNGLSDDEIAFAAQWDGDPSVFVRSITEAGFVDVDESGERWLHKWYTYAGKYLKRRADNAERMRETRATGAGDSDNTRVKHVPDTCTARAVATNQPTNNTNHISPNGDSSANATDNAKGDASALRSSDNTELLSQVHDVHEHYRSRIQPDARLTDRARKKIETRLKSYSPENLKLAIDRFSEDPWRMAHNAKNGMAWFFHTDDRIEQFMHLQPEKNDVQTSGRTQSRNGQIGKSNRESEDAIRDTEPEHDGVIRWDVE